MKNKSRRFDRFNALTTSLLRVSHEEVKAKLDAEKEAKKRKKSRRSSASREGV